MHIDIKGYVQFLDDDRKKNRVDYSMEIFEELWSNRLLHSASCILFMSPSELLYNPKQYSFISLQIRSISSSRSSLTAFSSRPSAYSMSAQVVNHTNLCTASKILAIVPTISLRPRHTSEINFAQYTAMLHRSLGPSLHSAPMPWYVSRNLRESPC